MAQLSLPPILDQLEASVDLQTAQIFNEGSLMEVLGKLERVVITPAELEESRLGRIINEIRKTNAGSHAELAKRCRRLIKKWQAEALGPQGPALRNGATPNTPASSATTPRSVSGRSASTTPALSKPTTPATPAAASNGNGISSSSYAPPALSPAVPKMKIKLGTGSPALMPASASQPAAGAQVKDSAQRRKRKGEPEEEAATAKKPKRRASEAQLGNGGGGGAPTTPLVVPSASGPKLKSTAELVADMNRQLPPEMSLSLGDSRPQPEPPPPSYADLARPTFSVAPEEEEEEAEPRETWRIEKEEEVTPPKKRRGRPPGSKNRPSPAVAALRAAEEVARPKAATPSPKETQSAPSLPAHRPAEKAKEAEAAEEEEEEDPPAEPASTPPPPIDWYASLPPIDPSALEKGVSDPPGNSADLFHHRLSASQRELLFLPFTDIGLPDFVQYPLPDRAAFLSELNWAYGREPPTE